MVTLQEILLIIEVFWFLVSMGLFNYVLVLHRRINILENNNEYIG